MKGNHSLTPDAVFFLRIAISWRESNIQLFYTFSRKVAY